MTKFLRDSHQAFNDAIGCGDLTAYEGDDNYAGDYMYMFSEPDGDWFKHKDTRKYVKFEGQLLDNPADRIAI